MSSIWRRAARIAGVAAASVVRDYLKQPRVSTRAKRGGPIPRRSRPDAGARGAVAPRASSGEQQVQAASLETTEYDVARLGLPAFSYSPQHDDQPDPGEVVWTWVPYEDDPQQGKDRPVLVLAREGAGLVVAQMTSKDHDRDRADEARFGRHWVDVGSGAWDARGRESEVRVDRMLWVDPSAVRREGAALDPARYAEVAAAMRAFHG
ncbi:type II toxin-antitoxin system PemK/MazF family toxin [Georgenia yuyongxinii]|uniref:Type II toxin-antitoxin system PemK/MazF family toxin n=1 Tax=Georgenia yuyongxinii TaxID=2589797 RepID=A0A552WRW7_9MICO|nr:type II toxin-antitoxin system PemK/MazF family toxin [Georgenia yuyongxinii]TRW45437.1 type II toxin-antitoxin system PemK/MazF family toxin [Georgenia yuyongxinii]